MKIYILVGFERDDNKDCWNHINHSIHKTRDDAWSEINVEKALGRWKYDDYDIEEHEL